jgi:hypothetical protein
MNLQPMLEHTSKVTTLVHDELIRWVGGLLRDAGLEAVDVWGRFPPEGTVRSHLVLFPYRVGPEPKGLENARGASIMTQETLATDKVGKVPLPWRNLGRQLVDVVGLIFPEAGAIHNPTRGPVMPYPKVSALPKPLRAFYEAQDPTAEDPWVVMDEGERYARPPSLRWRPGISVWAHYLAVAGDPGRGVADRTSDAPPLALAALSCLSVGIQVIRNLKVDLPAMPKPEGLPEFVQALIGSLREIGTEEAVAMIAPLEETIAQLGSVASYEFGVIPVHDLTMHEFALLTQALQRPLQAVLNFRLNFSFADLPEFGPSSVVSIPKPRQGRPPHAPDGR